MRLAAAAVASEALSGARAAVSAAAVPVGLLAAVPVGLLAEDAPMRPVAGACLAALPHAVATIRSPTSAPAPTCLAQVGIRSSSAVVDPGVRGTISSHFDRATLRQRSGVSQTGIAMSEVARTVGA